MVENRSFDIVVIGGGPAGMMAAGRAAELGAKVALLEKNGSLGRKLLLTGNGRCNLTNTGRDLRNLAEMYGKKGRFLYHAFSVFGVEDTIGFFNKRGLGTKVEENGRVFPATDRASDVLSVLLKYLKKGGVKVMANAAVDGFETTEGRVAGVRVGDGIVRAGRFILCTGGKSYPRTGSSGEAFGWLRPLGHSVTPLAPALVPITVKENWVREMEGASLRDVGIAVLQSGMKRATFRGEAVVTHSGLSGPVALDMSGKVRELMREAGVTLLLDLRPDMGLDELDEEILRLFTENPNKLVKNFISYLVPPKLAGTLLRLSGLEADRRLNRVSRKERGMLAGMIKGLPLTVKGLGGFERAMVTSGGVSLSEIDPYTMRSKLLEDLYFAGEVIDIDGPTGGYNLQACWSTGYLAGESAAKD